MLRPLTFVFAASLASALACVSPDQQHRAPKPLPFGVSAESLWRTPEVWQGREVRCILVSDAYSVERGAVYWYDQYPRKLPAVVFESDDPLPVSSAYSIEIVGTCRGRNGGSVVVISECAVTVIPFRLP